MANAGPLDYETQQADLNRRQKFLEAQQASYLTPDKGRMVGDRFVGPGIVEGVSKVLAAYLGSKQQDSLKDEQQKLMESYRSGLKSEAENYYNTREGAPAKEIPYSEDQIKDLMVNDQNLPEQGMSPATQANPRQAAINAVVSAYPQLQQLGMADLTAMSKTDQPVGIKDLLSHATPDSIKAMINGGGTRAFQGKTDLKTVGDVVFDPNTRKMVKLEGEGGKRETIDGDLYQVSPSTGQLKKLDNAPKVSVNSSFNPVIAGQKKGVEAYFTHAAGKVDEMGKQAAASEQLLNTLGTLKQLHAAGINGGVTSDMATTAANLAQSLGLKMAPDAVSKLANTETYNSLITDLWQRSVSQYGGNRGVTAAEADEIKKLTPMARNSPQAREQLFAIQEGVAKRNVEMYKQANKSFANAAAADDPRMFEIPDMIEGAYNPPASGQPNPQMPANGQPTKSNW